jgi:putative ABC transport system permease protein
VTALLERLFGRLPIGWLQLTHNKARFAAALAGVSFAAMLVLMQLGFLGAMIHSISIPYSQMNAHILIASSDMNMLSDGSPIPRQRMYEALAVEGVASATPLHLGRIEWKSPSGAVRNLDVLGVDPDAGALRAPEVGARRDELALPDTALLDRRTRNVPKDVIQRIEGGTPYAFETRGRTITVVGTMTMGGGFSADGFLVVSDQTFLRVFPSRTAGAPNYILVRVAPGARPADVVARLSAALPDYDVKVRTLADTVAADQNFQTTQRPVGLVFGFGIVIGVVVGIIVVYQVLSTDVADHIREYATFKAIGYPHRFFLGIVFEEAVILAILGFAPALALASALYVLIAGLTGLPLEMSLQRAAMVFLGTVVMCAISGAIATRKLARANPADLF